MALIGDVIHIDGLILRSPGGAITAEHQVVLHGELKPGLGKLTHDRGKGRIPAAVGEALHGGVGVGSPSSFVEAVNGVIEVHKTFPSEMSAVLLSVVLLASPFRHGASDWKFSF